MADNLKKKKADSKRIAFKQKHEVAYLKGCAKLLLDACKEEEENFGKRSRINFGGCEGIEVSVAKIKRVTTALLKLL